MVRVIDTITDITTITDIDTVILQPYITRHIRVEDSDKDVSNL